ncbi:S8 family serine peptidase [Isoptericola sp. 4D.3]|uniref:S8 family serine peptidase n=1 Tax=Isoptericola peretonis TaxID=2918523 RepID=A0ABT0IZH8_9MICO|nr:S8 family serine peptidase [Isoptericola sp. 4D.3]
MTESPAGPTSSAPAPMIRFLDPSTVRRSPGQRQVGSTWYVADRLLVRGGLPETVRGRLRAPEGAAALPTVLSLEPVEDDDAAAGFERAARRQGCHLGVEVRYRQGAEASADARPLDLVDEDLGFVLRLIADRPDVQPDAWEVLEADARDDSTPWTLSLDHVMTALPFTTHPFTTHPFTTHPFTTHPFTTHPFTTHPFTTHPFTTHPFATHGMAEYGVPGRGGRSPVAWLGAPPVRHVRDDGDELRTPDGAARPVVAIVDTGIGTHPWFGTYVLGDGPDEGNGVVIRGARLPDGPIGTYPVAQLPEEDAEIGGASTAPLTGPLDPVAGHGTFIAGIVHQTCPDALLVPVRVLGGSGAAIESEVIESLRRLLRFHRRGLAGEAGYLPVDVVVLPMGYYHEQPEDLQWDHPLSEVLARLRDSGVAVVVAAGNDGETRPEFPAAFAPEVDRRAVPPRITAPRDTSAERPPILAVGAANPDGSTALFSNDGPWVTCVRPGAAVVSTVPTTLDGPSTPSLRTRERYADAVRSTIDPEGFQGGFATWSGTSFAAPVLAGEIARELLADRARRARPADATLTGSVDRADRGDEARVAAIWRAISGATGGLSLDDTSTPG